MSIGNKARPVHEIRAGSRVRAAIWQNRSASGEVFYSVSVGRLYREKESEPWRTSSSLNRTDLESAQAALREAADWLEANDAGSDFEPSATGTSSPR